MKNLILALLVLACSGATAQCLLREVPLSQRISQSNFIVEGRVTAQHSFWNETGTMIYTSHTIEVFKVLKGNSAPANIEIITPGGTVGFKMIKVEPAPSFKTGETGLFMLKPAKTSLSSNGRGSISRYEMYASLQGFIKYDLKKKIASDAFRRYADIENTLYRTINPSMKIREVKPFKLGSADLRGGSTLDLSGFSPTTVSAGTGTVLTINGSGFGATRGTGFVRFPNADMGGADSVSPLPSQYISWSDNQIMVEVPAGAGTGVFEVIQGASNFLSPSPLTISFAQMNVDYDLGDGLTAYETQYLDMNGSGGFTWHMNTAFNANAVARASFMRAFDTWRCATQINWAVGATTAINAAAMDNTSIIAFDDAVALPEGVLGVCISYWGVVEDCGTEDLWWLNEADIIFDNGSNLPAPTTWEFGPAAPAFLEYDFESVAVHELGHAHQLGHVIDPGAVMHYNLANGQQSRSLDPNDIAGGTYVQNKSEAVNACGFDPITAYSGCSILPISITSLNAYAKNNGIQVEWTNANESNVLHYEIEESANGSIFSKAATVLPVSNNNQAASYEWLDQQVNNGTNYYRIRSVGINGEVKYTGIVSVTLTNQRQQFTVYPNPVKNSSVTLGLNGLEKGEFTLTIYNSAGQETVKRRMTHAGGNSMQTISLPVLAPGLYSFRLQGKDTDIQESVIIDNH